MSRRCCACGAGTLIGSVEALPVPGSGGGGGGSAALCAHSPRRTQSHNKPIKTEDSDGSDDMSRWCSICNEDAVLWCVGCDDDPYRGAGGRGTSMRI